MSISRPAFLPEFALRPREPDRRANHDAFATARPTEARSVGDARPAGLDDRFASALARPRRPPRCAAHRRTRRNAANGTTWDARTRRWHRPRDWMSVSLPHASASLARNDAPRIDERAPNARAHRNRECGDERSGEAQQHAVIGVFAPAFLQHFALTGWRLSEKAIPPQKRLLLRVSVPDRVWIRIERPLLLSTWIQRRTPPVRLGRSLLGTTPQISRLEVKSVLESGTYRRHCQVSLEKLGQGRRARRRVEC